MTRYASAEEQQAIGSAEPWNLTGRSLYTPYADKIHVTKMSQTVAFILTTDLKRFKF
jgi:hypothetical protein